MIDIHICAENCPDIVLLWILKGISFIQKLSSNPIKLEILQSRSYVKKSTFFGPKRTWSKIKSFAKKAIDPVSNIAITDLIRCHLKSSRWSKKDISSVLLSFIRLDLLLWCYVGELTQYIYHYQLQLIGLFYFCS